MEAFVLGAIIVTILCLIPIWKDILTPISTDQEKINDKKTVRPSEKKLRPCDLAACIKSFDRSGKPKKIEFISNRGRSRIAKFKFVQGEYVCIRRGNGSFFYRKLKDCDFTY